MGERVEQHDNRVNSDQDDRSDGLGQKSDHITGDHSGTEFLSSTFNIQTDPDVVICQRNGIISGEEGSQELYVDDNPIYKVRTCQLSKDLEGIIKKVWKITTKRESGTGFLYKIDELYGLFTCNHVIKSSKGLDIQLTNEHLSKEIVEIKEEDVEDFLTYPPMDITFLIFKENITRKIKKISDFECFEQFSSITNEETEIYAFGHPLGEPISCSKGKLSLSKPFDQKYDFRYKLSTLPGSSGSPVVTEKGDLLGIHKRPGTVLDCLSLDHKNEMSRLFSEDNKGTRMEMAVNRIKKLKKCCNKSGTVSDCLSLDRKNEMSRLFSEDNKDECQLLPFMTLVHEWNDCMSNFCNIYTTKTMKDGTKKYLEGSGFLCSIPTTSDQKIEGMFTTKVMIDKTTSFKLVMFRNNQYVIHYIFSYNIRWVLPYDDLYISFVAFQKSFLDTLRIDKFLEATDDVKENDEIIATSRSIASNTLWGQVGIVKMINGAEFYHTATTMPNGTGSPLLNKQSKVVGIHRGTDSNFVIGTCMKNVIEQMETKPNECIEARSDGDGVTNSEEPTQHVTMDFNVTSLFEKLNEWEIRIGPLNDKPSKEVFQEYMDKHKYVEEREEYKQDGNYLVLKIRSRGLQTMPVRGKWQKSLRETSRLPLLDEHPGVVWIKGYGVTQDSIELQIVCIAQPDNGLQTNLDDYFIKIDNKSSKNLFVIEENGSKSSAVPKTDVILSNTHFPEKRYVKLRLELCDNEWKPEKTAWFYTWKNNKWYVTDGIICRSEVANPLELSDYEKQNEILTSVDDYKWVFCNQIKCYNWENAG